MLEHLRKLSENNFASGERDRDTIFYLPGSTYSNSCKTDKIREQSQRLLPVVMKRGVSMMMKTNRYLDKNSLLILNRTIVETHFRYCDVIWGQCNETLIDKLQLLQNRAARVITKVKYEDADHLKLTGQFGWLTVRNLIKFDLGIFVYKSQSKLPETAGDFHVYANKVHSYQTRSAVSGSVFCLDMI